MAGFGFRQQDGRPVCPNCNHIGTIEYLDSVVVQGTLMGAPIKNHERGDSARCTNCDAFFKRHGGPKA